MFAVVIYRSSFIRGNINRDGTSKKLSLQPKMSLSSMRAPIERQPFLVVPSLLMFPLIKLDLYVTYNFYHIFCRLFEHQFLISLVKLWRNHSSDKQLICFTVAVGVRTDQFVKTSLFYTSRQTIGDTFRTESVFASIADNIGHNYSVSTDITFYVSPKKLMNR